MDWGSLIGQLLQSGDLNAWKALLIPLGVALWKSIRAESKFRKETSAALKAIDGRMSKVEKELTCNGGSSLKDQLVQIADRTNSIQTQLDTEAAMSRAALSIVTGDNAASFVTDSEGHWTFADGTLQGWTRRGLHEMLGDSWAGMLDEADRERVLQAWDTAIRRQMDFRATATVLTRDECRMSVHIIAVVMRSPRTGATVGWSGRMTITVTAPTSG